MKPPYKPGQKWSFNSEKIFLNHIFKNTKENRSRYESYRQRLCFINDGESADGGPQTVVLQGKVQRIIFQENIGENQRAENGGRYVLQPDVEPVRQLAAPQQQQGKLPAGKSADHHHQGGAVYI